MLHATELLARLTRDLRVTYESLAPSLVGNVEAILGPPESWRTEADSLSELSHIAANLREVDRALSPGNLLRPARLWDAVRLLDRTRAKVVPIPLFPDRPCSIRQSGVREFPGESWFFINGVATDTDVLRLNGRYLARIFGRPIELIYNPTRGLLADLAECMTGRTFAYASDTADYALERVSDALSDRDSERVILMGHSQGGIIVANVVKGLVARFGGNPDVMGKLEVYTFASASDEIVLDEELSLAERLVPFVEHFANTGDLVARLGVLSRRLEIPGRVFTREAAGHLLNTHYLPAIEGKTGYTWRDADDVAHADARLFGYREGRIPEALVPSLEPELIP